MTKTTSFDLTTSRISRLLRPLRLKCAVLNATLSQSQSSSKSGTLVTYTSRHDTLSYSFETSLDVIPPPDKLQAFSHLDKANRANVQLSKSLYDIRDAFRNIIQATHISQIPATGASKDMALQCDRVRRLTAICAAVMGEHIEEQVELTKAEKGDDAAANNDDLEVLNEFYEAVPGHYRKYTLLSHALSIIFSICPANHTLFYILLEVTTSHGLRTESEALLYRLLLVALAPVNTSLLSGVAPVVPLRRSVHSNYLKIVRDRLVESETVNDRAVTTILCRALAKVPSSHRPEIWTSKAMVRLARRFRAQDYRAFISLCHYLVQDVAKLSNDSKGKERADSTQLAVRDRLAKWFEAISERLITTSSVPSSEDTASHELEAIAELLVTAQATGLHLQRNESNGFQAISDALLCIAVLSVSSPHFSRLSSRCVTALTAIMREYHGPNIDTFNPITSISFSNCTKDDINDPLHLSRHVNTAFTSLHGWAASFRFRRLFLLEAWFWSNVLAHVESLCPEIGSHYDTALHRSAFADELERRRRETVKNIEQAERMHFAESTITGAPTSSNVDQTPSKAASRAKGSDFRWEELVGCWVLKTPLPVKTRRPLKRPHPAENVPGDDSDDALDILDRHVAKRRCVFETPARPRAVSVASSTSVSSYASPRGSSQVMSGWSSRMTSPSEEQENVEEAAAPRGKPTLRVKEKSKADRRRSAFASILADAKSNRVVLHAKIKDDMEAENARPMSSASRPSRVRPNPAVSTRKFSASRDGYAAIDMSSDDLNLFAYRSSEW